MQGPAVRGYRIRAIGPGTRLVVTLGEDLKSSTEVRFLAHAQSPDRGRLDDPGDPADQRHLDRWDHDGDPR